MNQQDLAASNPRPNTHEGEDQKVEAARRAAESSRAAAESSRASAEVRRERAEQERIAAEDSRQAAELDRREAEEQRRRCVEELQRAAKEARDVTDDLRVAEEKAMSVLDEARQPQKSGEDRIGEGMSLQLEMEQMAGYLAARFIGGGGVDEVTRQFESIAERCKLTKNDKLLIDTTGYDGRISVIDRFFLGTSSQIFALHRIKVACVCWPEQIDQKKFGALVAQNRGVSVEVFTDFQAAEEWLLE